MAAFEPTGKAYQIQGGCGIDSPSGLVNKTKDIMESQLSETSKALYDTALHTTAILTLKLQN